MNSHRSTICWLGAIAAALQALAATAQSSSELLEEVTVTATKKADAENVQDVPIAITAFGEGQLDALQVRDLAGLSFKMPNVQLDDIGTTKGVANFTIRGLGVNSSIPSIDPAVGVFVDGVYLGVNVGVVFDTFDIGSVETLRGPQGVLFGRNVTGGAVLINTGDPTDEFRFKAQAALDSGLRDTGGNSRIQAVVSGPLVKDVLSAKLGVYYNDDQGWFRNLANGERFGKSDTTIVRGALKLTPNDAVAIVAKYEHGESDNQGPAAQSHTNGQGLDGQIVNFSRRSFDFAIDEEGVSDAMWDQVSLKIDIDVPFGNGRITNILGYRQFEQEAISDIDATPEWLFHANILVDQDQISNELRYTGTFGERFGLTTGVYYFQQDLAYGEQRDLLGIATGGVAPALTQDGGGVQDHDTFGVFTQVEYDVSDQLVLSAGLRYTEETKDVEIASLIANVDSPCFVVPGDPRSPTACAFDVVDSFETDNFSPRVGFLYNVNDAVRVYGNWSRAFRAGGFNFRNTAIDIENFGPGPFGDERVDSFEVGFKSEPYDGARVNAAVFYNLIDDMQREINLADPFAGVVQVIRNTAEATIWGIELDGLLPITDKLVLNGSIGYTNGDYDELLFDVSGDGVIDETDLALDIPRLAPVTLTAGFTYFQSLGSVAEATLNVNYAYRDAAAYTDNNEGVLNSQNRLDGSLRFDFGDENTIALVVYGKNLTNEVQLGNDTQLPSNLGGVPLGGTFAPLIRGRQVGVEFTLSY